MSKIKVDEVETTSSNLKLKPKGTGLVKVKAAGGTDGTLELPTGGVNSVKLKSPAHSAGQSYTLTLPDQNLTAGANLHVKSTTGSGATAEGQLEFKSFATVDTSNMAASSFTTGTIPAANMPAFTAAEGASLKLVSKSTPITANNQVSYISFTLPSEGRYFFVGKNLDASSEYANPEISLHRADNAEPSWHRFQEQMRGTYVRRHSTTGQHRIDLRYQLYHGYWYPSSKSVLTMELCSKAQSQQYFLKYSQPSHPNVQRASHQFEMGSIGYSYMSDAITEVRFHADNASSYFWDIGTEILLYERLTS
jgi:hypothetical protein